MILRRIYSTLLWLYPPDYRAFFAAEMAATFDEAVINQRQVQVGRFIVFTLAEFIGLLTGACREWIAMLAYSLSHSNGYIDGQGLPDRLLMRPPGIAWQAHYGRKITPCAAKAGDEAGPCLNAYQTFSFGSSLRRLLILTCGPSRYCGNCR